MRTATFLLSGALGIACAHKQTQPAPANAANDNATTAESGDPQLGTLEPASTAAEPLAETPAEVDRAAEPIPAPIEPAAPTVATVPPGSALAPQPDAPPASKSEAELRERIQRTLARDNSLSFTAKRVRVQVERGRVTLLGEVRTAREKSEVEQLVEKVSGVRRVENRLAVIDQPLPVSPDTPHGETKAAP